MLLLVTKEKPTKRKSDFFLLYKVSLKRHWNLHSRILLELQGDCELIALSKNGDVAFCQEGGFLIYKPFSGGKVPGKIRLGNGENYCEGSACFVGEDEEMFAYSGDEYPEIVFAHSDYASGVWSELVQHDFELEDYPFATNEKLIWNGTNSNTATREVQFDGKNFVIRMEGHSEYENLLSLEYSEDVVLLDYDYTYLALDFGR